ncbi:hypothetical protein MKW98_011090 [Papaver atlanticum]|uniref:Uncharacterized protein n=1 Tax=Papaver atlanticum TaxID=357466 RepID=A0AAD4TFY1_9MAGN|nr:hypothetical protein MKW98_011090 [Papaver atlanticum]
MAACGESEEHKDGASFRLCRFDGRLVSVLKEVQGRKELKMLILNGGKYGRAGAMARLEVLSLIITHLSEESFGKSITLKWFQEDSDRRNFEETSRMRQ